MLMRAASKTTASAVDRRIGNNHHGVAALYSGFNERLVHEVEPADSCVFVEIAQNIRQLQRSPEMLSLIHI